jgi:hypothetical protein
MTCLKTLEKKALRLIDWPVKFDKSDYENAIEAMHSVLRGFEAIKSVYQVGSVSTPGISDIDLWVVFEDGAINRFDPSTLISRSYKYFFTHNLFGISDEHFHVAQNYHFFRKISLIDGQEEVQGKSLAEPNALSIQALKQEALEYLVKSYVVLSIEKYFNVVKVRNLLLHGKALLFDLGYFEKSEASEKLTSYVSKLIEFREHWFVQKPSVADIVALHHGLRQSLELHLREAFRSVDFYHPEGCFSIPGRISFRSEKKLSFEEKGLRLPSFFFVMHAKFLSLQRRVASFDVELPIAREAGDDAVFNRFQFISEACKYNRSKLPHFAPVPYGLNMF